MRSWCSRGREAERAHVVKPVGQFDQDHADVVDHRQQHLADAFGLPLLAGVEVELAQFGDAVHAPRHLFAEDLADLLDGGAGILDHVVQQAVCQAHQVHLHVGQNVGDLERVNHVWLAGLAGLVLVPFSGELEGAEERRQVLARARFTDLVLELLEELIDGGRDGTRRDRI